MEHTLENPYCSNPTCWCHSDTNYHATYTDDQLLIQPDEQTIFLALEVLGDHTYEPEYVS